MKYDLIINGSILIPDQTFLDGKTDVDAHVVLSDIERRMRGNGQHSGIRHLGAPGSHAVLICWDRVTTVEVRKHDET
jgi:hypothetical protein